MSKPGCRPSREAIKRQKKEKKRAEKTLRERQGAEGLKPLIRTSMPKRKCVYRGVEEEQEARQDATMPIRLTQVGALGCGVADLQVFLRRRADTFQSCGIRRACVNRIGIDATTEQV